MSNYMRSIIFKKVIKPLRNIDNAYQHKIMSNLKIQFNSAHDTYSFKLPLKSNDYDIINELENIAKNDLRDTFDNILIQDNVVYFNVQRDKYVIKTLENNLCGVTPPLLVDNNKNIIIEFSSPNIAKPFHLGHLRSTVLGNCISNINTFLQNQVTKINYLGDWGTQFGYIQLGMDMSNIDNIELQSDPIKTLYKVYVHANSLATDNPEIHKRAKEIFKDLELGDNVNYKNWQTIKHFTALELEKTYKRLGIVFDKYDWESLYTAKNINSMINLMEKMQLLTTDNNNRKVVSVSKERAIPIIKSDGSTLYITRDIAAAIDRYEKNKFDAMYYVVDYSQSDHFLNLIKILSKMKLPWVDRLKHVKFGRVGGMSTRKGTAIFLEDILDEAKEQMKQNQIAAKTTKVSLNEMDVVSDILGVSGIIVQDLKQGRMHNYEFNWETMFNLKGDSGIKLQYTHCRLCSLEENCNTALVTECDASLLKESEVDGLITLISQFDEAVLKSYEELEPCILTIYLFRLSKAISTALHKLHVKGEPNDLGSQRLLLFRIAKITLAQGMKLLGLTPLEKM